MKKWIWSIALIIIVLLIGGVLYSQYKNSVHTYENPVVTMEIADYGTVKIELYPDMAPNTVRNFISLINKGFYNGLTFHRVEDILIQGGDKEGTGAGVSEYTIEGEFKANGYEENKLKFERGTIGMARQDYSLYYYYTGDSSYLTQGYNSAGTQFFIMTEDEELNSFLFSLGCYSGEPITVISHIKGGCVVSVKDARYNIDNDLAEAILI